MTGSGAAAPIPAGVRTIRWAMTLLAPAFLLALAAAALDLCPAACYTVGGAPVSRDEWLRTAAPVFALSAGWAAAAAYGLWRGRAWGRACVVALFATVVFCAVIGGFAGWVPPALAGRAVLQAGLLGALAAWYLYRRPNVARYFRRGRG
jgi:hypothetical protein